jgi:release factor H-coupled RctB family protein
MGSRVSRFFFRAMARVLPSKVLSACLGAERFYIVKIKRKKAMGMFPADKKVSIIASEKSWIEGEAVRQLEMTAVWPGMVQVVGMPDLHPGKGSPIGAAFLTNGPVYPSLVGNDIGCGMGLWQTDLLARKVKLDKLQSWMEKFEYEASGTDAEWVERFGLTPTAHDASLGTIGGGNHFAELLRLEEVVNAQVFSEAGLEKERVFLLAHSGSRGLGEEILRSHTSKHGAGPMPEGDESYLQKHDFAVRWAKANRARIAERVFELIRAEGKPVLDVCHNCVVNVNGRCLHRKGAAPSDEGLVVVPGSRGDLSYLVRPLGNGVANGFSLPHGAGRKWKRSDCRGRLEHRYSADSLKRTNLGGRVICSDKDLLFEEAPQAYKDISTVIEDMTSRGFMEVIAILRPVLTFKKG